MTDDQRMAELLVQWQELKSKGIEVSLHDLCRDTPELVTELQRCIDVMERMARLGAEGLGEFTASFEKGAPSATIGPPTTPHLPSIGRFAPGQLLAGRYRIVSQLGLGGMGEVYRADDLRLGQSVALKFLPAKWMDDPERVARLHEEVRLARQISHPNVCRVYDIAEAGGQTFLSMEFIDGEDLASLLRRIGRLPADKGIEIARQLCMGLAAAHEKNVIHRDLKPANIMLDGRGKVRITDFGLARLAPPPGEETAVSVSGTLAYMAPEQLARKPATVQSDLYALGLILYEVFTGKRAFQVSALARHPEPADLAPPSSHVSDLDEAVERVILKCLESEPRNRPLSALAVAFALPGGGDPLAAAQAAGDTPSPELVAAAGGDGVLQFWSASLLLGGGIAAFIMFTVISILGAASTWNVGIKKSPDVLANRANELLKSLDWEPSPNGDHAFGCAVDKAFFHYAHRTIPENLDLSSAGLFWYRTSPTLLVPADHWCRVTPADPPPHEPGMANLLFDAHGRLTSLSRIPKRTETLENEPIELDPVKVDLLLLAAGVDKRNIQPARPEIMPEIFVDSRTRLAWTKTDPTGVTRIEIGGINGRPIWMKVVRPWEVIRPWEADPMEVAPRTIFFEVFQTLVVVVALVGSIIAAWRNIRSGRSDQRAALRIGAAVFVSLVLSMLLRVNSIGTVDLETSIVARILAYSFFGAGLMWVWYLAVEPMVRRAYPQCLISSTRLIYGRFSDPRVGRDILWGVFLAIGCALLIRLICVIGGQFGLSPSWNWDFDNKIPDASLSMRHGSAIVIACLIRTVLLSYLILLYLAGAAAIFRQPKVVGLVLWLTLFLSAYNGVEHGHPIVICLCNAVWITFAVGALLRIGLLSLVVMGFGSVILFLYPPALAEMAGSSPNAPTWLAPMLLGLLTVFGFVTSTKMFSLQAHGDR